MATTSTALRVLQECHRQQSKTLFTVPVGPPVLLPLNAYAMDWGFPYMISSIVMISEQTNQKKQSKRAAGINLTALFLMLTYQ